MPASKLNFALSYLGTKRILNLWQEVHINYYTEDKKVCSYVNRTCYLMQIFMQCELGIFLFIAYF